MSQQTPLRRSTPLLAGLRAAVPLTAISDPDGDFAVADKEVPA